MFGIVVNVLVNPKHIALKICFGFKLLLEYSLLTKIKNRVNTKKYKNRKKIAASLFFAFCKWKVIYR